ncbi:MAG: NAD(P)-dependent dehydrogenase (short-subunit alcohol dehydrogenase family) [Verrucomicrobiales bacterium]
MRDAFNYQDRTAIVTGGAGDIGSEIVRALHQRGMRVVIADIDQMRADALGKELGEGAG